MSLETLLFASLSSLVDRRVYRDLAPEKMTTLPRITFQQVGGASVNFLDSSTIPSKNNARMQINCWHDQRDACNALAREVANTLRAVAALHTTVLNEPIAVYEEKTRLYGTIQDFSFWV